jgi:hypothetical protein
MRFGFVNMETKEQVINCRNLDSKWFRVHVNMGEQDVAGATILIPGFVQAAAAVAALNGQQIDGARVKVNPDVFDLM